MKQTETRSKVREDWSAMTLYERFEQAAIVVLTGIIMIIITHFEPLPFHIFENKPPLDSG